jgi:diguanylate cyclase (GGDEF)-like protein/PAS domain S-box-containing protein
MLAGGMIDRIADTRFSNVGQRRRTSIMRHVLNLTSDLIFFIGSRNDSACVPADPESLRILDVNQAACSALAYSKRALLAIHPLELVALHARELLGQRIRTIYQRPDMSVDGLIHLRAGDGRELLTEARLCYLNASPQPLFVLVARDITQQERLERLLSSPPHADPLTGLPNRSVLECRLQMALCRATERAGRLAVLMIDVDHFKKINDEHGHLAGDAVLRTLAGRLTHCLRAGDILVRYGGDEFVVLIDEIADQRETHRLVDRILSAVRAPIAIQGTEFHVSVSIGITIADGLTASPLSLIGKADQAMYRAKALGRDRRHTNYLPRYCLQSTPSSATG